MSSATAARLGPRMKEVVAYVHSHPGVVAREVAVFVGPSQRFGYATVHRTIRSGFVRAEKKSGRYYLFPIPRGSDHCEAAPFKDGTRVESCATGEDWLDEVRGATWLAVVDSVYEAVEEVWSTIEAQTSIMDRRDGDR